MPGDRMGLCQVTKRWLCSLVVATALASRLGCAAAPAPKPNGAPSERESSALSGPIQLFLPLARDTVFTYAVWTPESPTPERLILQVDRHAPDRANLRSGNSIKRIELVPEGARLLTGGFLLKLPLELGAEWGGPAGTVKISAVDQTVVVPAGRFVGCLVTTETGAQRNPRSIVTTYCPGVGIVEFSVDDGEREERFELMSFGPRVDINQL